MNKILTENLFIKSEILKHYLKEFRDKLDVVDDVTLQLISVLDLSTEPQNETTILEMQLNVQEIVETCKIDLKNYYSSNIYWYLMYVCFGENALDEPEDMEYFDLYKMKLTPGRDDTEITAFTMIDDINISFPQIKIMWKINWKGASKNVDFINIDYMVSPITFAYKAIEINAQIRLLAFEYDYELD